jgi:hypothetical protein
MPKVLILAHSGFGKTTSIGAIPELGLTGLKPEETYIISVTSKPLPFPNSAIQYPVAVDGKLSTGKRAITNNPKEVAVYLQTLAKIPHVKNIVVDDINYLMQDWYMANALAKGWDAPKTIGFFMGQIFDAMEVADRAGKNVIILAHGENVAGPDGRTYVKLKSTGKMVDEYLTPEGKVDITLLGVSTFDSNEKKIIKRYLTRENEFYSSAKSPYGLFSDEYIPNDLGLVVESIKNYYGN